MSPRRDIASPCVSSSVSNASRQRTLFRRKVTVPRTCSLTTMFRPVKRANASKAAVRSARCRFSEMRRVSSASPVRCAAASFMRAGGGSGIGGPSSAGAGAAGCACCATRDACSNGGGLAPGAAASCVRSVWAWDAARPAAPSIASSIAPSGTPGGSGASRASTIVEATGHAAGSGGNAAFAVAAPRPRPTAPTPMPNQTAMPYRLSFVTSGLRLRVRAAAGRPTSTASRRPHRRAQRATHRARRRPARP
ncbi:hypothetical protein FEP14_05474 [Burkholderia multivorans]|nr:hypothetical protein [Burkholderia multivorans]